MKKLFNYFTESEQLALAKVVADKLKSTDVNTIKRCMVLAHVIIVIDQKANQWHIEKNEGYKVLLRLITEYLDNNIEELERMVEA